MQTLLGGGSSGGGGGSSGGGGGGMWMQTGTVTYASQTALTDVLLPISDDNGAPEMLYICQEAEEDYQPSSGDFFCAIAAPTILPKVNMYGYVKGTKTTYAPYVALNSYALQKDATSGNYRIAKIGYCLNTRLTEGFVYRWIAIGGLSE